MTTTTTTATTTTITRSRTSAFRIGIIRTYERCTPLSPSCLFSFFRGATVPFRFLPIPLLPTLPAPIFTLP